MQNIDHFNQNTDHLYPTRFQILLADFFQKMEQDVPRKGAYPACFRTPEMEKPLLDVLFCKVRKSWQIKY